MLCQVCSAEEGLAARQDLIETWQSDGWAQDKIDHTLQVKALLALPLENITHVLCTPAYPPAPPYIEHTGEQG